MKKIVFILCILVQVIGPSSWSQAQELAMAAALDTHSIWGGVVQSVSWADQDKGTKSEITVRDTSGNKINIYVMPTTTLWDKDDKAIMRDSIVPQGRVNVIYFTTPEGINVGKSIKLLQ